MTTFSGFGLPAALAQSLERMQYTTPTPIQMQAIPPALEGKDILGSAQTGTGKTAAFSIPLVSRLMNNPRGSAIIMLPTRELAVQVVDVIKKMLGGIGNIPTALLIGGESMGPQFSQLRARPRVIVGTPGRINDHLERGTLMLHDTNFLVLDEMDRMLDMGFSIQIDRIIKFLPKVRQTLMFSATLPANILKMSEKYLNNPVRIAIGQTNATAPKIKQEIIHTEDGNKYSILMEQLTKREGSIIIFVKTKRSADKLADKLNKQGQNAEAIHGDLQQRKRDRVIAAFRAKKYRIMVATDIASRGLDIPHIEHVINYDLPQAPEDYIHRIGRTARAGAEGSSVCLISPDDSGKWRAIHRLLHPGEAPPAGGPSGGRPSNGNGNRRRKPFRPFRQGGGNGGAANASGKPQGQRNRNRPRAVAA